MTNGSVSFWISRLQAGNDAAQDAIWRRFHQRLTRLAARILPSSVRVEADEEDVVNVAFQSFFRRLGEGRFPEIEDRNDLWRLLNSITRRKAILLIRRANCAKRRTDEDAYSAPRPIEAHEDSSPQPDAAAMQQETIQSLLALLDDDLKAIALGKLDGLTNREIAAQIRRSLPTVERRLRLIRKKWEDAAAAALQE